MKTAINSTVFFLIIAAVAVTRAQTTNLPPPTPYSVVHRDANSEVLQQTFYTTSRIGKAIPHIRSVTRIETGLNYWDGKTWSQSDPTFRVSADGQYVYADKVQTKVRLLANLAASNSVCITTPDGIVLNTTPMAVGLYDAASGNSIIIASITNCTGTVISSNQVLYENAFEGDGLSEDIVYTLKPGSFSQDVVWKQNIDPADYGFPTNSTRIQIFTAFNSPAPQQTARPLYVERNQAIRGQMASPDFIDHTLKFGQLKFGPGRAFSTTSRNRFGGAPVAKDLTTINGQSYLVESVEYNDIEKDLASLPRAVVSSANRTNYQGRDREEAGTNQQSRDRLPRRSQAKEGEEAVNLSSPRAKGTNRLAIPMPHSTAKATFAVKIGRNTLADAIERKGVVADYVTLDGSEPDPMVFQGDTTYFVSGEVDCDDAIFEGGTVLKFPNDTFSYIEVDGNLTCETGPYLPAIFTSADDDSVGQSMNGVWSGYTGTIQPGGYAGICLSLLSPSPVENCRFCYGQLAVESQLNFETNAFYDCQFVNCGTGLFPSQASFTLENCLVANVTNLVDDDLSGNCTLSLLNCTVDNCETLMTCMENDWLYATNSIFSDIGSLTNATFDALDGIYGSNNGFYSTNDIINFSFGENQTPDYNPPYQTVGAGNYYLADNTFRGQGTTNTDPALLADLAQRTTWPPAVYDATDISSLGTLTPQVPRDTSSAPDLGYHYSPLDYLIAGCDLETNLIVTAGTAIGYYFDYDAHDISDSMTLNDGANLAFTGTVTQPCIFARTTMVQEGGSPDWYEDDQWTSSAVTFNGSGSTPLPFLSANFTKWTSDYSVQYVQGDYGTAGAGSFMNCEFYNDGLVTYDIQSLNFTNCLFSRSIIAFWDQNTVAAFCFDNCTFYNGGLAMCRYSYQTPEPWTIENCSFDGTAFVWADNLNGASYTFFNYNAYNANNLSWQTYPYFSPTYSTNEVVGPNDLTVTNYNWQSNWFGNFYLPSDSPLVQKGSKNANFLGLYEFTTQTNQIPETNAIVDIGYHYVATDTNGNPLDTYVSGTPNYIVDSQGNGMDTNGLAFWWEAQYFQQIGLNPNSDPDGNGTNVLYDYTNGINPNDISTINPIMLGSWNFDNTNTWIGNQGQFPTTAANLVGVPSWETNAVFIDSTNAVLGYMTNTSDWAVTGAGSTIVNGIYSGSPMTNENGVEIVGDNAPNIEGVDFQSPDGSGFYYTVWVEGNGQGQFPPIFGTTNYILGNLGTYPPPLVEPLITTDVALLGYSDLQPNGEANFNLRNGTFAFWFLPNWASTNAGGVGPQNEGRLIEVGDQGTTAGWWSLVVSSAGTNIYFATQTNSISTLTTNLIVPISWQSNTWHQIVLAYTPTNSSIYLDGQAVTTRGLGVSYYPNLASEANGFTIGGSLFGTNQAAGAFDQLKTFNYPVSPLWAWQTYTNYAGVPNLGIWIDSPTNGATLN